MDLIETLSYTQMVVEPIRFLRNTILLLIDHAWLNTLEKVLQCIHLAQPVAYHNIVVMVNRMRGNPRTVHKFGSASCIP